MMRPIRNSDNMKRREPISIIDFEEHKNNLN